MNKYSKDKAEIGARIKEIRVKRKMTQEYLAEKVGISNPQQLSNIECGLAGVSLARFKEICKVLEADANYLLFGITSGNVETVLHNYLKQMTAEQLNNLLDLVKVYAKSCGIDEI